jgi:hypothetical protein
VPVHPSDQDPQVLNVGSRLHEVWDLSAPLRANVRMDAHIAEFLHIYLGILVLMASTVLLRYMLYVLHLFFDIHKKSNEQGG